MNVSQHYEPAISRPPLIAEWRDDATHDPAEDTAYHAARIIIVDDDPGLRELLTEFLVDNGLGVEAVSSGAALRARLVQRPCDLVILDMMMPGEDGLSVLRGLAQFADPPGVIMLSALSSEVDRVVALEMGADDYVTKPSTPREILARIRSVLRRRNRTTATGTDVGIIAEPGEAARYNTTYRFAGWTLNCRMRSLQAPGGEIVSLTEGEFQMMDAFVTHPHAVHTREDMIALSGRADTSSKDRTIDVNISRLRRKLAAFDRTEIIRTVRGKGYLFIADVIAA
ncbi:response regulator [Sphingomonas sp. LB3N6]|uniref:response regulator n=1 Tax=Sphingomonas fucosidasi TaxID=3096164 RepID=UPI002FC9E385